MRRAVRGVCASGRTAASIQAPTTSCDATSVKMGTEENENRIWSRQNLSYCLAMTAARAQDRGRGRTRSPIKRRNRPRRSSREARYLSRRAILFADSTLRVGDSAGWLPEGGGGRHPEQYQRTAYVLHRGNQPFHRSPRIAECAAEPRGWRKEAGDSAKIGSAPGSPRRDRTSRSTSRGVQCLTMMRRSLCAYIHRLLTARICQPAVRELQPKRAQTSKFGEAEASMFLGCFRLV